MDIFVDVFFYFRVLGGGEGWIEMEISMEVGGGRLISEKLEHFFLILWYQRDGEVKQKKENLGKGVRQRYLYFFLL